MRRFCELVFGKAAVVGFMLIITPKPKLLVIEINPHTGRETLLSLIDRRHHEFMPAAYWRRIFGN